MLGAPIRRLEASLRMEHSARFELAWSESLAGFAGRCLQPLGHECGSDAVLAPPPRNTYANITSYHKKSLEMSSIHCKHCDCVQG